MNSQAPTNLTDHYQLPGVSFKASDDQIKSDIPTWIIDETTGKLTLKRNAVEEFGVKIKQPVSSIWKGIIYFTPRKV